MKRIAILGGSFNPFHNGHAAMLDAARTQLQPDELWLLPAKQPPHKPSYGNITDRERTAMLEAFAADFNDVKVCTAEMEMQGFTYTANTLAFLHKAYPDASFVFLIGGDSAADFDKWYRPEAIVQYADIAICTRKGCGDTEVGGIIERLSRTIGGNFIQLQFENVDISSSELRKLLTQGGKADGYIPAAVLRFIQEHKLYSGEKFSYSVHELEMKMREILPPKRYTHVLGVFDAAVRLAKHYGCNQEKAAKAAVLHDCAKMLSAAQLINLCRQNEVAVSESEAADEVTAKSLLHSKAGSILARNLYYIEDEEILSAIYYHTVGRPGMTLLEKIIFVADYIEPGRTQRTDPPLDVIRNIAFADIDRAVYLCAENTVRYLREEKRLVDAATLETMEYYRKDAAEH